MSSHSSAQQHHITPVKIYLGIGALLLVLTGVTVALSFVPFGAFNMVVALTIATFKALLVGFFFMHLYYDNKLYFACFAIGLLVLTVFIVLTMFDTMERGAIYPQKERPIDPTAAMYDKPQSSGHGAAADSSADTTKPATPGH